MSDSVSKHHYLEASELLVKALAVMDNDLQSVDGLKDFRADLSRKKEELFTSIIDEISKQLYLRPSEELLSQLRNFKGGHGGTKLSSIEGTSSRLSIPSSVKSLSGTYLKALENEHPELDDNGCAKENKDDTHPESNPVQYIGVLAEALGVLGKLREANYKLSHDIQRGLSKVIMHTTLFVYDHFSLGAQHSIGEPRNLAELLGLVFRQFKIIASLHGLTIDQLSRVQQSRQTDPDLTIYTLQIVWNQIQAGLQHLLNEYLDVKNAGVQVTPPLEAARNLSSYFAKRRPVRPKNPVLFRFEWTKHSMNVASYKAHEHASGSQQQSSAAAAASDQVALTSQHYSQHQQNIYVCPPAQGNIVVAFRPLMRFVVEIESRLGGGGSAASNGRNGGNECLLREFIEDYVRETFLPRIGEEISGQLDASVAGPDAWTTLSVNAIAAVPTAAPGICPPPPDMKPARAAAAVTTTAPTVAPSATNAPPMLASVVRMKQLCQYVNSLMLAMPLFSERLAEFWLLALKSYHSAARGQYDKMTKSIIRHDPTAVGTTTGTGEVEWRKISAAWAVDEDISRLLKSLPNWLSLLDEMGRGGGSITNPNTPFSPANPGGGILSSSGSHFQALLQGASASEIRERNARESEILIGNLGTQKKIEDWEIFSDIGQLKFLANMHESIDDFCNVIRLLLSELGPAVLNKLKEAKVGRALSSGTAGPNETDSSSEGGGPGPSMNGHPKFDAQQPSVADEFEAHMMALEDMASTCLLMLHLEVRVHCFYYLLPIARQASHLLGTYQSQEVDPLVLSLNRNLVRLDESLRANLRPRKVRYVFEGLGHLVSAIFINSSQHIHKINDNGKKRMSRNIFAIQQCLSNITGARETDLDAARRYFELLYRSPDEILGGLVEARPEFSELEYNYLLALAVRSHPNLCMEPGALEARLSRLREIMSERKK